jgi:group I intron endonuclease
MAKIKLKSNFNNFSNVENKPGIYKITNLKNGKVYIGESKLMRTRWVQHRYSLSKGKMKNQHMQRSFNKIGCEFFRFDVVCYCEESRLIELQKYYIEVFNSLNPSSGYNRIKEGETKVVFSDEMLNNMSIAQKERYKCVDTYNASLKYIEKARAKSNDVRGIPITRKDANGVIVWFKSSADAIRQTQGLPNSAWSNIKANLKGQTKSAYGYEWQYVDEERRKHADERRIKIFSERDGDYCSPKAVKATNIKTGAVLYFDSSYEAAKDYRFHSPAVSKCCRGLTDSHKGYTWEYLDKTLQQKACETNKERLRNFNRQGKPTIVIATNIKTGEETTYESIIKAERDGGFLTGNICSCLKGRSKTHKGYQWRYA